MRRAPAVLGSCLALVACLCAATQAAAQGDAAAAPVPAAAAAPDGPSGRDIYERVVNNRFHSFRQRTRLVSGDRAGNEQESRMLVTWRSFRDGEGPPRKGVLSKAVIRYTYPFDLRSSAYLIINNEAEPDDQFMYLNSRRRVQRVNLRGEPVLGSDFSFEDVVPRELEDATYQRLPDDVVDGRPTYVIEVTPRPDARSQYSRFRSWVDRERSVVLKTLYWDEAGVQVKELDAPSAEVRSFDGVWVPMRVEMRDRPNDSYTYIVIEELAPNPLIEDAEFDPHRLEQH
ncbi:MAG TPA: outer membrane lipoprotein-sorting protein [Myxococcota bacterium]|nr:outer membrane lipoprotein-sorting protein [Myxococcota bacterium]